MEKGAEEEGIPKVTAYEEVRSEEREETVTLGDGGQQEWRGRNERGEGQDGSLSGHVCGEGGVCVGSGTGASGLGAGRGSVFHLDDNYTGVSSIFCW